ncbi:hypothetical protein [Thermaerobacter composti]|uniref:Uncharacterized protein n=1 Tax=Thermaerobacter composti TaxID=554949 RepID=A0ABZ0QQE0_9FIRM|nr:hypothetical protein [Thermaerobacter composti]PZN04653.1 MAG: hypothetical protein DIU76_08640 [Bacillota bacterium]WPD19696.1 hypothetical protein Q5761_03240 [Thermaerobacter composti]
MEVAVALALLGLLATATVAMVAWTASQQARAGSVYDGVEAGHVAVQVLGRLVRSAGAAGRPAVWEAAMERLVLCGVPWQDQVLRGQVARDGEGRLVLAAVPPPAPPDDRCAGADPPAPIDLVPGATFQRVRFAVDPAPSGPPEAGCGPGPSRTCAGVRGLYVWIEPRPVDGGGIRPVHGYVALRNPGGR